MQRHDDQLTQAVSSGQASAVEAALARVAWDLNALDMEGGTLLHRAVERGRLEVVQVLLARGADPNVRRTDGLPALNVALDSGSREIVDALVAQGAKLALPRGDVGAEPVAWLIYTDGRELKAAALRKPGVVIGRDAGQCSVALEDFGISRVHARIDVGPGGQMTLTDLKSKGGSQVNGVPVVQTAVAVKDRLRLGAVTFVLAGSMRAGPRLGESSLLTLRPLTTEIAAPGYPLETKLTWIDGICTRVADAHDNDVVLENLHDGRIHVAADGRVDVDLSASAAPVLGMSPEQLRGRPADSRSDVFAAAWIAYQILTRRSPFEGESLHAVMYRVLHEEPPDPRSLAPDLPVALAPWLQRGLAKEPAERFASGGAMLEALRRQRTPHNAGDAVPSSAPRAGGQSIEDAVPVERVDEEYAWLEQRPCACGGRWELSRQVKLETPQLPPRYLVDVLEMRCASGHERKFFFRVDTQSAAYQHELAETRRMMGLDD